MSSVSRYVERLAGRSVCGVCPHITSCFISVSIQGVGIRVEQLVAATLERNGFRECPPRCGRATCQPRVGDYVFHKCRERSHPLPRGSLEVSDLVVGRFPVRNAVDVLAGFTLYKWRPVVGVGFHERILRLSPPVFYWLQIISYLGF